MLPNLIAVIGPTGSGKTALARTLALAIDGELISCDAKQVYKGMDIGTNKEKNLDVPQHLLDIKEPGEKITVAEYQQRAYQEIERLCQAGKVPILVGGSMLYAEAVINGYQFAPDSKSTKQQPRYRVLKLAPLVPRGELHEKLRARTQEWLDSGLLDEIQTLLNQGVSPAWLESCGLEYNYFTQYLRGEITREEAVEKTDSSLRKYVKRQFTWWRRHSDIHWVESQDAAIQLAREFLNP